MGAGRINRPDDYQGADHAKMTGKMQRQHVAAHADMKHEKRQSGMGMGAAKRVAAGSVNSTK